ncbi:hypothetical protein E8E13_011053 [Curvularia kusanoi]|uniref:Rhodopsin domain-containing protein n=1 Tax=Curvularia kusanoi TaxID=90978 RepID=A0A9P4TJG4_CURKU|nr:hypothetical protein E8E13_011053 [Curvularia kusanoi]
MSLGILTAVTSIIRSHYLDLLVSQDFSYEAYKSIIWSAVDSSMSIVAISMPVLRVILQRAVSSAVGTYLNESRKESRFENSKAARSGTNTSSKQFSSAKQTLDSVDLSNRSSKGYLELDDFMVDKTTARATVLSKEQHSKPNPSQHKAIQRFT